MSLKLCLHIHFSLWASLAENVVLLSLWTVIHKKVESNLVDCHEDTKLEDCHRNIQCCFFYFFFFFFYCWKGKTSANVASESNTVSILLVDMPLWSRLLVPGVFKPSCSTPFTLFFCFFTSRFCLPALSTMFHSKNSLHNTSIFSFLLIAYFYLTGHSPVFIYNTALLYIILLTLWGHLQTQRVCCVLHPVSGGRMGSWWLRSPVGSNTLLQPDFP